MKISFILTTVDKEEELQNCIISIEEAYKYRNDIGIEILAVIQNTKNPRVIKTGYPELSTFYYIPRTGLSAARNFAIIRSSGDYLVFLDDDAAVRNDFIDILLKNINEADSLCGRIINPVNNQPFSICFLEVSKRYLNRFNFRYFMGSAHVLKKTNLEEIGLYDDDFGAGSRFRGSEETDVFFRLIQNRKKVLYIPDLVFFHPVNYKTSTSRAFNYAYALSAVLVKQIIEDKKHFFIYTFLLLEILLKSLIRTIQTFLFLNSIKAKNDQFQFRFVLAGTVKGILNYISYYWVK